MVNLENLENPEKLENLVNRFRDTVKPKYVGDYEVQIISSVLGLFGFTLEDPVMSYTLSREGTHVPNTLKATIRLWKIP